MSFLISRQLGIMLFMAGSCGVLAIMTLMLTSVPKKKRSVLSLMELSAMFLLLFDRGAYRYRGVAGVVGTFMTRFCNGLVFFLALLVPYLAMRYLATLRGDDDSFAKAVVLVRDSTFAIGTILIVVTQFTGLYYSFTDDNLYVRSPLFVLAYVFPFVLAFLQVVLALRYGRTLGSKTFVALLFGTSVPIVASVAQIFLYGVSLTSMALGVSVTAFHVCALKEAGDEIVRARKRELDALAEAERTESEIFEETAEALACAVDAKDEYTHGHSMRVAAVSERIAVEFGVRGEELRRIRLSALLHDVGKIGVRDEVLKKKGRLTPEEYEEIKEHAVVGNRILSRVVRAPWLGIGAFRHHERYDGTGYPGGLKGEEIPWEARVIAVADAYDAMSSTRSYRKRLSDERIREEFRNGAGSQFDPELVDVMLRILDEKS